MFIWLLFLLPWVAAQGTEYFQIEKMYMCEDIPDQLIKLYLTPKTFTHGIQTVDINITSPTPIGENTELKCLFYTQVHQRWILVSTSKSDFCTTFRTYVGQIFYDLERAAGIMPGVCPIPKGSYHAVNHKMDFEKLKLQSFMLGKLKFRLESYDKTTKLMRSCVIVIISNEN